MKFAPLLVLSALVAAAPTAFAASTTDITVTGTITPAACTPSVAGGGNFDFGTISAGNLYQDYPTPFRSEFRQMTVVCDAPTRFALHAADGKAGSALDQNDYEFGLGLNGDERIGQYRLQIQNFYADGDVAKLLASYDGGSVWGNPLYSVIPNTSGLWLVSFSKGSHSNTEPSAIETLTAELRVQMNIAPAKDLTLTDDVKIDGASTIEVVYL